MHGQSIMHEGIMSGVVYGPAEHKAMRSGVVWAEHEVTSLAVRLDNEAISGHQ